MWPASLAGCEPSWELAFIMLVVMGELEVQESHASVQCAALCASINLPIGRMILSYIAASIAPHVIDEAEAMFFAFVPPLRWLPSLLWPDVSVRRNQYQKSGFSSWPWIQIPNCRIWGIYPVIKYSFEEIIAISFQKVENKLFQVLKNGFNIPGTTFEAMFALPQTPTNNNNIAGSSLKNPIKLAGIKVDNERYSRDIFTGECSVWRSSCHNWKKTRTELNWTAVQFFCGCGCPHFLRPAVAVAKNFILSKTDWNQF
jgi:hypothetical protein